MVLGALSSFFKMEISKEVPACPFNSLEGSASGVSDILMPLTEINWSPMPNPALEAGLFSST